MNTRTHVILRSRVVDWWIRFEKIRRQLESQRETLLVKIPGHREGEILQRAEEEWSISTVYAPPDQTTCACKRDAVPAVRASSALNKYSHLIAVESPEDVLQVLLPSAKVNKEELELLRLADEVDVLRLKLKNMDKERERQKERDS
jgi:hypothetical protein